MSWSSKTRTPIPGWRFLVLIPPGEGRIFTASRQGITHVHRVKVPQGDGSTVSSLERTTVKPRRHIPDSTYLVTRRCLEGVYRLVPDGKVNAILLYCLLYASQKHGIKLHGFCFMSNHFHLVLTAPKTQLGEFMHWLDLCTSKCLNCLYGRRGTIWEPGTYSSQELHRKEDIVSKLAYVACNPVQAALVKRPGQWPGNISLPRHFLEGYDFTATRPKVFFRQAEDGLPRSVSLALTVPRAFRSRGEFRSLLEEAIRRRSGDIHCDLLRTKRKYVGKTKLRMDPNHRPGNPSIKRDRQPYIACEDRVLRKELIEEYQLFWSEHRRARRLFREGKRGVLFPHGTYWWRVQGGVRCRRGPPGCGAMFDSG